MVIAPVVEIRVVSPEIDPDVALIIVVPSANMETFPPVVIVATDVTDELQVTEAVKSFVELSEYVPVALNCWVAPTAILELVGVTAMDTRI
jgi:hypothetical protein